MDGSEGKDMDEIRAAIIPPIPYKRIPGYCLVMKVEDGLLTFIAETQDDNWIQLLSTILDLEQSFRYSVLYTIMQPKDRIMDSFFLDLYKQVRSQMPWIKVMPAPYANDIPQGIALFTKALMGGGFVMPPESSTLFSHLRIEAKVLPEDDHYAFHALRFILSGLSIQPKIDVDGVAEARDEWLKAMDRNDLTGMSRAAWDELDELKQEQKQEQEEW